MKSFGKYAAAFRKNFAHFAKKKVAYSVVWVRPKTAMQKKAVTVVATGPAQSGDIPAPSLSRDSRVKSWRPPFDMQVASTDPVYPYASAAALVKITPKTVGQATAQLHGLKHWLLLLGDISHAPGVDRAYLSLELDLRTAIKNAVRLRRDGYGQLPPSQADWAAVHGDTRAVLYLLSAGTKPNFGDIGYPPPKTEFAHLKSREAAIKYMRRQDWKEEREATIAKRKAARARTDRDLRVRAALLALMPKCKHPAFQQQPRMIYLATESGRSYRDPRKQKLRRINPGSPGNGWDDIVKIAEETPRE